MAERGSGTGTAADAAVEIKETDPDAPLALVVDTEAAERAARLENANRAVRAAEVKVEKQRAHLAGAEEALANAQAELEAI